MQQLMERIRKEGKVLPGNIIKVDGFLNHRVDTQLMGDIADEFAKYFDVENITMVLTAEASGIALATICAQKYNVPMVFAKKAKSDNIEGGLYQSEIFSYTYKKKVTQILSKEWLTSSDRVLIVDDFMANGEAVRGLCDLVSQAGAELVGIPATRTKVLAYVICGVLSAVAGIIFCSRIGIVTSLSGNGYEMKAVAPACWVASASPAVWAR